MIKRLIWTIWTPMSSVLKKADKLNLSLSLTWISDYIFYKVWVEIIYRFPNRYTIEVWWWISNFTSYFIEYVWWWNEEVTKLHKTKWSWFKVYSALKKGGMTAEAKGAKTACTDARHVTKHTVWLAKSEVEKEEFATVSPNGDGVFHIVEQMDHRNQDIVGENCLCSDAGELELTAEDKSKAWIERYARLLNIEFEWPSNKLPEVPPMAGPPPSVPTTLIHKALSKMKCRKAAGPSRLEGPEDPHLRNSRFGGHVTPLMLQHLWPRPLGVWLGGPGCKPGHSGWS